MKVRELMRELQRYAPDKDIEVFVVYSHEPERLLEPRLVDRTRDSLGVRITAYTPDFGDRK